MEQKIFSDIFNISKRIKEIDRNYYITFNLKTSKFILRSKESKSIILTLPMSQLDVRALNYIKSQLSKSNEQILFEVEKSNERYIKNINNKITLDALNSAERVLRRR